MVFLFFCLPFCIGCFFFLSCLHPHLYTRSSLNLSASPLHSIPLPPPAPPRPLGGRPSSCSPGPQGIGSHMRVGGIQLMSYNHICLCMWALNANLKGSGILSLKIWNWLHTQLWGQSGLLKLTCANKLIWISWPAFVIWWACGSRLAFQHEMLSGRAKQT